MSEVMETNITASAKHYFRAVKLMREILKWLPHC
jgi:hypothetical protein